MMKEGCFQANSFNAKSTRRETMAHSGNSGNPGNAAFFIAMIVACFVMGGMMAFGFKTFAPSVTTTFAQKDAPNHLTATIVESEEEKTLAERFASGLIARDSGPVRALAGQGRLPEITMTENQDNAYVTYEIGFTGGKTEDVKVVVTARRIEVTARHATAAAGETSSAELKKEISIPPGVDHTRAEVSKKDGVWIVKLPKV